jgi:hypothetical protein
MTPRWPYSRPIRQNILSLFQYQFQFRDFLEICLRCAKEQPLRRCSPATLITVPIITEVYWSSLSATVPPGVAALQRLHSTVIAAPVLLIRRTRLVWFHERLHRSYLPCNWPPNSLYDRTATTAHSCLVSPSLLFANNRQVATGRVSSWQQHTRRHAYTFVRNRRVWILQRTKMYVIPKGF